MNGREWTISHSSAGLRAGTPQSFADLLDLYYDTIHRFAWKWCGHAANADDIAQLACLKLANSLAQYRFQAAFTSWLYRLVISCAQDWQRSQQRHEHDELPEDEPAEAGNAAEESIYLMQLLDAARRAGRRHEGNRAAGACGRPEPCGSGRDPRRLGVHDFLARAHHPQADEPAGSQARQRIMKERDIEKTLKDLQGAGAGSEARLRAKRAALAEFERASAADNPIELAAASARAADSEPVPRSRPRKRQRGPSLP